MAVAISGLPAATVLANADVFEVEQSGVSKKITSLQISNLLFPPGSPNVLLDGAILPQNGDVINYKGSAWISGATPRWRVIHQNAYSEAAVTNNYQITFTGGGPTGGIYTKGGDYFAPGSPVRTVIAGTTYYGICYQVTDNLLSIAGGILPLATAITSLSVGNPDMVKLVRMQFVGTTYNGSAVNVLTNGCQHRWHGATGYLCQYSCCHQNTSATTVVQLQMNAGSNVSTAGVIPAAGTAGVAGAFTDVGLGNLIAANVAIANNQTITAKTPTVGDLADYLVISMAFVVP